VSATDLDMTAPFAVHWKDVVFARPEGMELQARLYEPVEGPVGPRPVVVDVHGGAWNSQSRKLGEHYDAALAACGLLVVAIDFRDGRNGRHPVASADVLASVRWVRANEEGLSADASRVALIGSSSGGHLALHAAVQPQAAELKGVPIDTPSGTRLADEVDASVSFVGAFWPPVDPLARYLYAREAIGRPVPEGQRFAPENLVRSTEAYFGDEETMAAASVADMVEAGSFGRLPPLWVVCAGEDLNVPRSMLDRLVRIYRAAGGEADCTVYEGQVHGFGHAAGAATDQFIGDLRARLQSAL
jgi:acetyl esterase/lipase